MYDTSYQVSKGTTYWQFSMQKLSSLQVRGQYPIIIGDFLVQINGTGLIESINSCAFALESCRLNEDARICSFPKVAVLSPYKSAIIVSEACWQ